VLIRKKEELLLKKNVIILITDTTTVVYELGLVVIICRVVFPWRVLRRFIISCLTVQYIQI